VYSPCHELTQAHELVRGELGRMAVVLGRRGVRRVVSEKDWAGPGPQGPVGPNHELGRGDVRIQRR